MLKYNNGSIAILLIVLLLLCGCTELPIGERVTCWSCSEECKVSKTFINGTICGEGLAINYPYSTEPDCSTPPGDKEPPTPNPSLWPTSCTSTDQKSISMFATVASDPNGVEYYFEETSGNPGGTDSGWQTSNSYADSDLNCDTEYTYRVRTRDSLGNTGEWSLLNSVKTNKCPEQPEQTIFIVGEINWNGEENYVSECGLQCQTWKTTFNVMILNVGPDRYLDAHFYFSFSDFCTYSTKEVTKRVHSLSGTAINAVVSLEWEKRFGIGADTYTYCKPKFYRIEIYGV